MQAAAAVVDVTAIGGLIVEVRTRLDPNSACSSDWRCPEAARWYTAAACRIVRVPERPFETEAAARPASGGGPICAGYMVSVRTRRVVAIGHCSSTAQKHALALPLTRVSLSGRNELQLTAGRLGIHCV